MSKTIEAKPGQNWKITIRETKAGVQWLERTPRYQVYLNGQPWGEPIYYNMTGYCGYLPTPAGRSLDIGERGISAYRKYAAELNSEAREITHGVNAW